jgi:hypothetical protein
MDPRHEMEISFLMRSIQANSYFTWPSYTRAIWYSLPSSALIAYKVFFTCSHRDICIQKYQLERYINSLTAKSVPEKLPLRRLFASKTPETHSSQTPPPWWSRLPLQCHGFVGWAYPTPGSLCERGWPRSPSKGFSWINKLNEKLIYFCCLSVDDNNQSPAVGNDSQNGIHCCRRATIIYELKQYIVTNNSIHRLYY